MLSRFLGLKPHGRGRHGRNEPHEQQQPQGYHRVQEYYGRQGHQGHQQHQGHPEYQEHYEQQVHPGYQEHRPNSEYKLYNLPNLEVRTLQDYGYEVLDPFKEGHPLAGKDMWLYDVVHPGTTGDNVIARLGVWDNLNQL